MENYFSETQLLLTIAILLVIVCILGLAKILIDLGLLHLVEYNGSRAYDLNTQLYDLVNRERNLRAMDEELLAIRSDLEEQQKGLTTKEEFLSNLSEEYHQWAKQLSSREAQLNSSEKSVVIANKKPSRKAAPKKKK